MCIRHDRLCITGFQCFEIGNNTTMNKNVTSYGLVNFYFCTLSTWLYLHSNFTLPWNFLLEVSDSIWRILLSLPHCTAFFYQYKLGDSRKMSRIRSYMGIDSIATEHKSRCRCDSVTRCYGVWPAASPSSNRQFPIGNKYSHRSSREEIQTLPGGACVYRDCNSGIINSPKLLNHFHFNKLCTSFTDIRPRFHNMLEFWNQDLNSESQISWLPDL